MKHSMSIPASLHALLPLALGEEITLITQDDSACRQGRHLSLTCQVAPSVRPVTAEPRKEPRERSQFFAGRPKSEAGGLPDDLRAFSLQKAVIRRAASPWLSHV